MLNYALLLGGGTLTPSGRKIWLHESKEVVCLEFDYWGQKKVMHVDIAKYRTALKWGTMGNDITDIPSCCSYGWYVGGEPIDIMDNLPAISDAAIQSRATAYRSDWTGRENCNAWMKYQYNNDHRGNHGVPCVQHARNLNIAGFGAGYFDIPNLYELAVIYAESDSIDALDPSLGANPGYALGKACTCGRFRFSNAAAVLLSSTNSNTQFGYLINGVHSIGEVSGALDKDSLAGVVPARVV